MQGLLQKIERSHTFWFLVVTSVVFFLLRLPSFFEPYWYGDEGVYEVLGYGIRHGRLLYQGVWDNKPPLLYLIYALFDGNQPFVRFFSFIVGLLAVWVFFALAKKLFVNRSALYTTTALFALFFGLPLLEGNIANAENFMILPALLAMYYTVRTIRAKQYSLVSAFSIGFLLGISFLIKVVAVFDFTVVFLFIVISKFAWNKTVRKIIAELFLATVGFLLPLLITIGFFTYKGMLVTFIQSAFLTNVGYVNFGNQLFLPFTHIAIPQGFLLVKLFLLLLLVGIIFLKRKLLTLTEIFLFLWLPFSLFNAFFSQRPYTHYLLVLLPSLILFTGLFFEKKWRIFNILFFLIIMLLVATNFWFYGKTVFYYQNFVQMLTGQKSVIQYQAFFDKGVPRDYAITTFLNTSLNKNQTVFLWTNSAQVYYLIKRLPLGRYTTAYHMTASNATLNETENLLMTQKPNFVIIFPNASSFPFSLSNYSLKAIIEKGLVYERTF